ncbi:MAG: HD domain-containing protein [Nocardioidaceae bacterium]
MSDLARDRSARADAMDHRLRGLFDAATAGEADGLALVGVGGYGRRELSPRSDVDVVLLHDPGVSASRVAEVADACWYPLWDEGVTLDHAVRDTGQMCKAAADDLRSATGMLDARHLAGDRSLTLGVRSTVLTRWRADTRTRLPALRSSCVVRHARSGAVAHAAVPDLKESSGGLRDGTVLRALVATWLVDVPHAEAEAYRSALLDVRDVLHQVTGRRTDRLAAELVPDVAAQLGMGAQQLDLWVRDHGRRVAHLLDLTWRRVDQVLDGPRVVRRLGRPRTRRPALVPLGPGVARVGGEVVLTGRADPAVDPCLPLRAAATAAEHALVVAPATVSRLARVAAPTPEPWPDEVRRWLVRLLAAGPGLRPVWEQLDQVGIVDRWLPEWSQIRLRSSSAVLHRFTIDRHSIETCVEASALLGDVDRPDLLVVAGLLHDIGKGHPDNDGWDHCHTGAAIALQVARRWGFVDADAVRVEALVRHHLLLPTVATRCDLTDPSCVATIVERVTDRDQLDLLAALTQADALAAAPAAWTPWRRTLVRRLVDLSRTALAGCAGPPDRRIG